MIDAAFSLAVKVSWDAIKFAYSKVKFDLDRRIDSKEKGFQFGGTDPIVDSALDVLTASGTNLITSLPNALRQWLANAPESFHRPRVRTWLESTELRQKAKAITKHLLDGQDIERLKADLVHLCVRRTGENETVSDELVRVVIQFIGKSVEGTLSAGTRILLSQQQSTYAMVSTTNAAVRSTHAAVESTHEAVLLSHDAIRKEGDLTRQHLLEFARLIFERIDALPVPIDIPHSPALPNSRSLKRISSRARAPRSDAETLLTDQNSVQSVLGSQLRLVSAGEFLMGSPEADETAYPDERPQPKVIITKPFYVGCYPVTQREYSELIGINPSQHLSTDEGSAAGEGTLDHPVENISWMNAIEFCNRLSQREGLHVFYEIRRNAVTAVGGNGYRLPTEAEWEYACRAGNIGKWCFGDDLAMLDDYAWVEGNADGKTQSVGLKAPNAFGLYDVHGNVWEWCWDWYDESWYQADLRESPDGPRHGELRVLRGGSWRDGHVSSRSANRYWMAPQNMESHVGFRLVRSCLA